MHRAARLATFLLLPAGEVGAVVTLGRLGRVAGFALPRHGALDWVLHAPTEDLFAVASRLLGLALAWWLLAATVLSIARRVVPGLRRLRALDAFTPAVVRHGLDRALVLGLGASMSLAGVGAAGAAVSRDVPVVRAPGVATPPRPTVTTPRPVTRAPASRAVPDTGHDVRRKNGQVAIVRAGDNLWVIAERALGPSAPADAADIAPYWRRVITANVASLRSHDPNLIFPGERIVLPPTVLPPTANGGTGHG